MSGLSASRTRTTALIVACALFMQNLDSTVISTALPTMARAFGEPAVRMNVALTSYLLSLAVFIPASGWVADRFGARNVFRAAILVFTIGSVLCGRAESLPFLVGARILQGVGGAMMVPVGRLLLLRTAAKSELVAAMAWLSTPALIGPVLGPPLGGLIVERFAWPWIFDINVPIGLIGIVLVTIYIPDTRETGRPPLDFVGLVLSGVCLALLMIGFETAGRGLVDAGLTATLLGLGAASGVAYALHARRVPKPLLDFGLLRFPTFMVAVVAGTLFRIGIGAVPFLLPLMLQLGFGYSPVQSGLVTFASSAGAVAMKPAATRALRRFGFRRTLIVNGVISSGFLLVTAAFRPAWPIVAIYAALLFGGFFRSLQFTSFNTLAFAEIPRERMSGATSLYSTIQQVSLTLGVTIGAATLEAAMAVSGHGRPELSDFSAGFVVVSACLLISAPVALWMPASAGAEMSGQPRRG